MKQKNLFPFILTISVVVFVGIILLLFYPSLSETAEIESEEENDTGSDGEITTGVNIHQTEAFPVIYVSVFTHIEEASIRYPNFVDDEENFWAYREAIVAFAEMLQEEDVSYNFQSDWTFLLAATEYDEGTATTDNKNFLQYLKEDLHVEIDPHAHETKYTYADVAYLIEQLGVTPSFVVGGLIASPSEDSKLEYLWTPIKGKQYPSYTWKAEVGWGGGTSLHQNEEALWVSGIWKPQDNEHFLVHDDDAPLTVIGHYNSGWDGLDELLELQEQGVLSPGKIYTISIPGLMLSQLGEDVVLTEEYKNYIEEFREQIQSYEDETATGKIKWVGLGEVYDIWLTEYNAEPNQLFYTDIHTDEADSSTTPSFSGESSCGDGVCQLLEKKRGLCEEDCG